MFSVPKLSRAPYQFALIHAHGAITTGASHNESMGSDTVREREQIETRRRREENY